MTNRPTDRVLAFEEAMREIFRRAKNEAKYNAKIFATMLAEFGGLETAHHLLRSVKPQIGLDALCSLGRPDLTVEALVLQDKWRSLFTDAELQVATDRLTQRGYSFS
jgi:hypothetical protein